MPASEPRFRLVRSISGSHGSEQNGRYTVEDPRTTFSLKDDRHVIVYFEWDGPLGSHRFEGRWKNPEGKVVVLSDFSYEARQKRFGAYWSLTLTDGTAPGLWALEAYVDGEHAGTHAFQIVAEPKPAEQTPSRRLLPVSEIYQRALASTVLLERLDSTGRTTGTGSGFVFGDGLVLTAFQVIDGASALMAVTADGRRIPVSLVANFNRWQDWALLRLDGGSPPPLPRAPAKSWQVGDRCFTLEAPATGGRNIVDADIQGAQRFPDAGGRLTVSHHLSTRAVGSPLLNEYGEVIGVMGGAVIPGISSLSSHWSAFPGNMASQNVAFRSVTAVPIDLVPETSRTSGGRSLLDMAAAGYFIPALEGDRNVDRGTVARALDKRAPFALPVDERWEYSRRDQKITVYVLWRPQEKRKGKSSLLIYDVNNRLVNQAKPGTLRLNPGTSSYSTWDVDIANVSPGVYRFDVVLETRPIWRTFVKITE
ncbi:MAG TPA: serine protease [Terriglobales bacterium]|nr:serine protease [Terriglobales bacterium]